MTTEPSLLDEIRRRRKAFWEIVLFAVFLSLFVNLLASALYSVYSGPWDIPHIIPIAQSAALILVCLLVGYGYLVVRQAKESTEVHILLPIIVKTEDPEIKVRKGYAPTKYAAHYFNGRVKRDSQFRDQFVKSWSEDKTLNLASDPSSAQDVLHELVQQIILGLIGRYGEHTLEPASRYHPEYRAFPRESESVQLLPDQLPEPLRSNPFNTPKTGEEPQKWRLPAGFSFSAPVSNFTRTDRHADIVLKSGSGEIRFRILPYWVCLRDTDRRFQIFTKGLKGKPPEGFCLLQIPVCIDIALKRFKFRLRPLEDDYLWMKGLMADARKWLDWEHHEKDDMERIVVGISQELTALRKTLEETAGKRGEAKHAAGAGDEHPGVESRF